MKIKLFAVLALLLIGAGSSFAYEQKLHYPNTGASVIGMQFISNPDGSLSVEGNVTYRTRSCTRYRCVYTDHNFIGTWDALGRLLSQVDGALPPQTILFVNGNEQVYAQADAARGLATTGFDSRGYGYVDIPVSHFTWTGNNQYLVIPDALYQFQVTLSSDGDFPLNLEASSVFTDCRTCYYNNTSGSATIVSTTDPNDCTHVMAASVSAGTPGIPVGTACTFTILYDPNSPTTLRTGSGQGLAYTDLTLALTTDAGSLPAWGQQYTITGVPQFDE